MTGKNRHLLIALWVLCALLLVLLISAARFPARFPAPDQGLLSRFAPRMANDMDLLHFSPAEHVPDYVGSFFLIHMEGMPDPVSDGDLARIHELGIPLSLVIRDDGTAKLEIFDTAADLTWDQESMTLISPDGAVSFSCSEGLLTIREDGSLLLFQQERSSA